LKRLPFFFPMRECPHRCIYCNQNTITGESGAIAPDDVRLSVNSVDGPREICFFGGSFTCFDPDLMTAFLDAAVSAGNGGRIRISTHPLCISDKVLDLLESYPVCALELGVTSLDDEVLATCNRGYTARQVLESLRLLMDRGFLPGAQLMTGLPGQSRESCINDLYRLAEIKGASDMMIRLYPCLVLEKTALAALWNSGQWEPPCINETARTAGEMIFLARRLGFTILRTGLHETPSLAEGVLAGPHHPAMGELAMIEALAAELSHVKPGGPWMLPKRHVSLVTGHGGRGLETLSRRLGVSPQSVSAMLHCWP